MYMKKIYTLAKVLILSAIFYSEANAQCPEGFAVPFHITYTDGSVGCEVRVAASPHIGFQIVVFNNLLQKINLVTPSNPQGKYSIGSSGGGTALINCLAPGQTIAYVSLINELPTIPPSTTTFDIVNSGGNVCIGLTTDIVTPIKLTKFTASIKSESTVQLSWTSAQEAHSSHFLVEKSGDGKSFTSIGTVAAAGFSDHDINYGFQDVQFSTTSFYRLKMVDDDGKFEYSKVVYVNSGKGGTTTLSVFPNPFKAEIQLKGISASEVNSQNIKVFNVAGKQVGYRVTGSNSITIDGNLPQGIYILRVKDQTYKLIKE